MNMKEGVEKYLKPDVWQQVNPNLHVFDEEYIHSQKPTELAPELGDYLKRTMQVEGYYQLNIDEWGASIPDMAQAVKNLMDNDIMTVFMLMYDETWAMFNKMHHVVESTIGKEYKVLPNFWCWHVDHKIEEAGWGPHRDGRIDSLNDDNTPNRITIWIPLTNATTLNGCMYIVPMDRDKAIKKRDLEGWEVPLQDIRALPAKAGDMLCWNQIVYHWGSRSSKKASEPRISMALEYHEKADKYPQNSTVEPLYYPSIEERFFLCARQILHYRHMYKIDPDLERILEKHVEQMTEKTKV